MKKVSFIVLLLLSTIGLVACNSASNIKGEFLNNEYVLSLNDVKDFYDEFSVEGVDKEKISLVSSNSNILSTEDGKEFKASSSGKAYVFAKYKNKTVAKAKVNVRYKLSSPQNFNLSSEGVLSWDNSFAVIDGQRVEASAYKVEIGQIVDIASEVEYQEQTIQTNSFTFEKKASYSVKVTAISDKENLDNSDQFVSVFHNGVMGVLENVTFEINDEFASQEATLTWDEKPNAKYDVYVEGFLLSSDSEINSWTFDYSIYKGGDEILVEVFAKDKKGEINSSSTQIKLKVLETPDLKYTYSKEGYLTWTNDTKASAYLLQISNYAGEVTEIEITDRANLKEVLEGYSEDIYDVSLMALGGDNQGYYISSQTSEVLRTAKIAKPEVEVQFVDNKLNVTFAQDEYVTDYKIAYNFQSTYYSTLIGQTLSLDMSFLPAGEYSVDVIALPKADATSSTGVAKYSYRDDSTNIVLNSDKQTVTFYVLEQIGEIIHVLNGNTSTFTFPSVENANFYQLYINDIQVEANIFEENGIVTCQITNLKYRAPKDGGYEIKIVAGHKDLFSGKEIARRVEKTKRIEILDAPQAQNNLENGTFAWQDISQDCLYSYEVYKTQSDYALTSGQTPILSETAVDKLEISQTLGEGYYKIKVKSVSKDTNVYLDSDFFDEDGILEVDFFVTKEIEKPDVRFFVEDGQYKLDITAVDYASLYEIYVDGNLDGQIVSVGEDKEEYIFSSTFESEGKHEVEVHALAGDKFDENIYLDAEEAVLNVTRLAKPEYLVNISYSDFDSANHEWLTLRQLPNSSGAKFILNGSEVSGESYRLDLADHTVYGSSFRIGIILKAGASVENEYFLDSHLSDITFERIAYPTNIKYTSGDITWTQNADSAERNYISLIVDKATGSDYYKRFQVPVSPQSFDLQSYIETLRAEDLSFDTAYRQVEKLQLKMLSYLNDESDKYYLPSFYGTAFNGSNTLEIKLLENPVLSFDVDTQTISWQSEEGNLFDIYIDDKLVKEGYSLAKSITLQELNYDWTTQRKVTVRARNESYLDSDISNAIYIKQLASPASLSIAKDGNDYKASVLINSDNSYVESVYVNGSSDKVQWTAGGNVASFLIKDYSTNEFTISLIAKNDSDVNYYISSNPAKWTLKNLADSTFTAVIDSTSIAWNAVAEDISKVSVNPIRYVLSFTNNGKTWTKSFEDQTYVNLDELETIAGQELVGSVSAKVTAIVNVDYQLSADGVGYYGEISSGECLTNKLASFQNVEVKVIDGSGSSNIEKKTNSSLLITFSNEWSSYSNVSFNLKFADQEINLPQSGLTHLLYTFKKVDGKYQFKLSSLVIKNFGPGIAGVTLQAVCDKQIPSNVYNLDIKKYARTQDGEVTDDGVLKVVDRQQASYLVEIAIEDSIYETQILKSLGQTAVDLMTEELIVNKYGAYTIKVLTFDEENLILPANDPLTLTGYKLQGLESVYINDEGNIIFNVYADDLSEIEFTALCGGVKKQFTPVASEENVNQYSIAMLELIEVFGDDIDLIEGELVFNFAIKDKGSMDSAWKELKFNYAIEESPLLTRGKELDKDYIIYPISEKSGTVSFRTIITASFPQTSVDEEGNEVTTKEESVEVKPIMAESILGYWVTDAQGENGYFVTEKGTEVDLVYTDCYAICVNDIFENLDYGTAQIKVSRIGKQDQTYYQYNEWTFDVYKLNKINDEVGEDGTFSVKDNFLNFTWSQLDQAEVAKNIVPTAYYVLFENENADKVIRITSFVCSVDLTTVGLTPGESYNIYVIALSAEKAVIASQKSESVATLRYTTPLSLSVQKGILTFDQETFKNSGFMQDIINYFAQTTEETVYHNEVGTKQYKEPYFFTPALLDELYVTLNFTKLDATGGVTNQVYKLTLKGTWLFPEFEIDFNLPEFAEIGKGNSDKWLTLLQKYALLKLTDATSTEATNVMSMIEELTKSPRGIGDNAILFDDLGRQIPSGDYLVNLFQTKSNQFIESENSPAVKMHLSASPEISLQTVTVDNISQYTIDLTPSSTMNYNYDTSSYELGGAMRYKLSLRPTEEVGKYWSTGNLELIITYNDTLAQWEISYDGIMLENVISNNLAKSNYGLPGFTINMSKLRKVVNDLTGEETIKANTLMRADIFVYNQDDGYVLNGKSAVFNVRYLDLSAESINFTGGKFVVHATLDNTYELLIKYKLASQGQSYFTEKFVDGQAVLHFEKTGLYEYIVLSLKGSISQNTMNVESSSYAIANLYKLSAPTLATSNSNLIIDYNPQDSTYMNTLEFNMANDISLHEEYNSADKGYYYQSYITSTSSMIPYVVGSRDLNGETLYPSELMASTFYAYLNGNSGTFAFSDQTHAMADYLLEFSENWAIMTSDLSSINARMLAYVDGYDIVEGHLLIDDRHIGINIVSDKDKNYLSGNLVYEVHIDYFVEDNDNPGYALKVGEETYYSERQYASDTQSIAQAFSGLLFNSNYHYFSISVTVLGALRVDETTPNAIRTVEGTYVLLKDTVYFYDDGAQVLRSQTETAPFLIARTAIPYLASGSKGVRNGNINFVVDKSIYFAQTSAGVDADTAQRISLYAEWTKGGQTYLTPITGQYTFTTSTVAGEENNVYVAFTPDEGQLNDIVGSFKVRVYAYGNGTIMSNPLVISDIYKLTNISSKYYQVVLDGINTVLDLSAYFNGVAIVNDNTCYKLVILYQFASGEVMSYTLTSTSSVKRFVIPADATILSIQSQDGQDETEANAKKLLYSDTTGFNIQKTDIDGLNLSWNSKEMRFEWSWEDGRTDNYEYHISITVGNKTTTEVVTTNYYLPKDRGLIGSRGFEIRARKLEESDSQNLNTYSDGLLYQGEEVLYDLFSGGNGSKTNPYLIRNKTDFINMSKRNRNDFYFKLDTDKLSIDMSDLFVSTDGQIQMLMQNFNAHLDGNSWTIEIVSSQVFDLGETWTPNLIGKPNVSFNEYSSLFRNLSVGASISNMFINYVIDYEDLYNSNVLFAPLCAFNYGTIDNVKISSTTITSLDGRGESNTALVGGLASVNYGVIKNCSNTAVLDYTMAQQLNLTFGYAGIATFNANITTFVGTIENCYNFAAKNISVTVNNNLVYLAGITLTNGGIISKAGNDGALKLSAKAGVTSMTGYYAGVVIANNNGTLEYVYNNAVIENTSDYGTFNYGGVAYTISSGKINTLVTTVAGQPLVRNCSNRPSDSGSNYASSDSGTTTNIATKEISAQEIDCGNGWKLTISQTDSGWKASISNT